MSSLASPRRRHEVSLLLAVVAVFVVTTLLDVQHNYWVNPRSSAIDLVRQWSMLALFSLGAAVVIVSGGIDLSTGSVIAFSGTICATLLLLLAPEAMTRSEPLPMWVMFTACVGTLGCGFLIGSLHAWLITVVGLPPFVATLATLVGLRSLARAICESATNAVLGGASTQIGIFDGRFRYLATSVWIPAVLVAVLSAGLWLLMSRTVAGRHLYALGGNEQAAHLSGIRTDRLKWLAYSLSAMLSSLAGILYVCEQSVADPQTLGRGYELNAIAAAVVGGCSLRGGVGTVPGTLLGALFLRAVIDGVSKIIKTGADVYEGLIVGVVVVFAVVFTGREATNWNRRSMFSGGLGIVTLINLTLLAGGLMALVGVRLLGSHIQMDVLWLSTYTMMAVGALLWVYRQSWNPAVRRRAGIIWAISTLLLGLGLEYVYPTLQTRGAISAVRKLSGEVRQNDSGLILDFRESPLDDEKWKSLVPRLAPLQPIATLRWEGTNVTDASLNSLDREWSGLVEIDVRRTRVTSAGIERLKRRHPRLVVLSD